MAITYTEEKRFTKEQTQDLFLSVGWVFGQYPERLFRSLMQSSTVLTAWDGDRLVGLARALDDGDMVVFSTMYWYTLTTKERASPAPWSQSSKKNTVPICILVLCRNKARTFLFMKSMASRYCRTEHP